MKAEPAAQFYPLAPRSGERAKGEGPHFTPRPHPPPTSPSRISFCIRVVASCLLAVGIPCTMQGIGVERVNNGTVFVTHLLANRPATA
jgi:hypothetical protein